MSRRTTRMLARAGVAAAAVAAPMALATPAYAASGEDWDSVAECESSQQWGLDSGNGYYGGLQFSDSTWDGYGGEEFADQADEASREQQIAVAERVLEEQGWSAWPTCSEEAGVA